VSDKGMFTELMEASKEAPRRETMTARQAKASRPENESPRATVQPETPEDLSTVPYIGQNYRFTEDELKWVRRQAYELTERLGAKVHQNLVVRIALHYLREACADKTKANPLVEAISKIKK
jgi:hypothetical protein